MDHDHAACHLKNSLDLSVPMRVPVAQAPPCLCGPCCLQAAGGSELAGHVLLDRSLQDPRDMACQPATVRAALHAFELSACSDSFIVIKHLLLDMNLLAERRPTRLAFAESCTHAAAASRWDMISSCRSIANHRLVGCCCVPESSLC